MSVTTSSTDPVQTVYDILNGASEFSGGYGLAYGYLYGGKDTWTNTAPEVYKRWNWGQQDREMNNDPAIYIWSPESSNRPAFSADYDTINQNQVVEASVWMPDGDSNAETKVSEYAVDVINLLEEYGTDNKGRTKWNWIRPTADNDFRAENITRKTDHFVINVIAELRRLSSTGL